MILVDTSSWIHMLGPKGDAAARARVESVSFTVGTTDSNPSISEIKGIKAKVGVYWKVTEVEVVEGGFDVTTRKGFVSHTTHISPDDE